jgi:SPP1 family phage portal protein
MSDNKIGQIQSHYMYSKGDRQEYLKRYYDGDKAVVPVYQRKAASPLKEKTHTNIHTNFFADIVDRKVGYMGQSIKYSLSTEMVDENRIVELSNALKAMERRTKQATMNSQSVQKSSVSGISHRLCYTEDGVFKIKNLDAWQVVYEYDNDIFDPDRAYYFYSVEDLEGDTADYCNVYDRENVYYFVKTKADVDGNRQRAQKSPVGGAYTAYSPDGLDSNEQPHNFSQVPLIPFMNNTDLKSDCEDTVDLMDVYDEIISDTAGELKAARLAYLKIWGDLYTGEDSEGNPIEVPDYLREFGTMLFGTDDLGNNLGDAQFLEKSLDDSAIMNMKNTLRESIFEISGSVDLKQLTDASAARVFTIKASLMRLENSSKTTENLVRMALNKQIKLWAEVESILTNSEIDADWFEISFKRSFIEDVDAQSSTLSTLINVMAAEDAYRIAGFEDPKGLAERYEEGGGLFGGLEGGIDEGN